MADKLGRIYGTQINAVVDAAREAQMTEDPRELMTIILYALAVVTKACGGVPTEVITNFPNAYANIDFVMQENMAAAADKKEQR